MTSPGRLDRYMAAVAVAQVILESPNVEQDELRIQQAADDIRDEVEAGRRNQQDWPKHMDKALERIGHSVKVDDVKPYLTVVKGDAG